MPLPSEPALSIADHFADLPDPRLARTRLHELLDIITIALWAVIAGADSWDDVAEYGRAKHDWLRTFLPLPNGIPSHDTFNRVFARLDPQAFQGCFTGWVRAVRQALGLQEVVASDGKSLRHSFDTASGKSALHLVSAWAAANHLTLGQVAVDDKSNEITAIPKLLEILDRGGAIVTIDALGCQKDIARQIRAGGADYVLALKDNQPGLLDDVQACFEKFLDDDRAGVRHSSYASAEHGHGRVERRTYTVLYLPPGLRDAARWADLGAVCRVTSERIEGARSSLEARYYLGSLEGCAEA